MALPTERFSRNIWPLQQSTLHISKSKGELFFVFCEMKKTFFQTDVQM